MKKPTLFLLLFVVIALIPTSARADTIAELQAMINQLLAQVEALQEQIKDVGGGATAGFAFERTLGRGAEGGDVSRLQEYFASVPGLYPEGLVTGYFGTLSERATQRFQARYGIVSAGTPASTGYGLVGPKTRAKLNELLAAHETVPTTTETTETTDEEKTDEEEELQEEPQEEISEEVPEETEEEMSDIVGHWTFNETSGTSIADASGGGSDGELFNADETFAWISGKIDGALKFDDVDDYISIPHTEAINTGAEGESYTVSFWFNRSGVPNFERFILGKSISAGAAPFEFRVDQEGYMTFRVTDGIAAPYIRPPKLISGNGWNYIVGVRNAETDRIHIYINGEEGAGTGTEKGLSVSDTTTGSIQNEHSIRINRTDAANGLSYVDPFRVDDVRIYNRVLTEAEIKEQYDALK